MFIRGSIGANREWATEVDFAEEKRAIYENWIKPGKMLAWHQLADGFRMIGPKFQDKGEEDGLMLEYYSFPNHELFMEWALAPEHIAMHVKLVEASKAALASGRLKFPAVYYNFHATNDATDTRTIRNKLRDMYAQMEQTEWAAMPSGMIQKGMLGDHD